MFNATHRLTWHGAQIAVRVSPEGEFVNTTDGQWYWPAYTHDEWNSRSTAQWTLDVNGRWYLSGQLADVQVEKLT